MVPLEGGLVAHQVVFERFLGVLLRFLGIEQLPRNPGLLEY